MKNVSKADLTKFENLELNQEQLEEVKGGNDIIVLDDLIIG